MLLCFLIDTVPQRERIYADLRQCLGLCHCHCLPYCGGCGRDWHLLTPEGREEFCRNLPSILHCISISWVPGFYSSKSINQINDSLLGFAGSVNTGSQQRWACRSVLKLWAPMHISALIFLGLVPYKMAIYVPASIICASELYVLGCASVDWEACLSKNEITAGSKLFACVVSPAQPPCFSSFQSEIVGKSHAWIG